MTHFIIQGPSILRPKDPLFWVDISFKKWDRIISALDCIFPDDEPLFSRPYIFHQDRILYKDSILHKDRILYKDRIF